MRRVKSVKFSGPSDKRKLSSTGCCFITAQLTKYFMKSIGRRALHKRVYQSVRFLSVGSLAVQAFFLPGLEVTYVQYCALFV